jgi:hypothetical protein
VPAAAELTLDDDSKIASVFKQMYPRAPESMVKALTPTLVMAQFHI